ncbi:PREDICTED: probable RNA-binding protein 18 [Priapulus caudatus]|uniref:Probable RNA-binding protein 18 n=1 Tax=Priapulus caudatus TaxID=37621 RepID=A0ABM1DQN9_PRICU|nr:PREDICTED: probable RNA-binding protein 18 [Priapulus caudatus]
MADIPEVEEFRLYIGNLNPQMTELQMIKILQKYGKIKRFDFLYHKAGPLSGKPRGYSFVSFIRKEDAERAVLDLDRKFVLGRKLTVRPAHERDFQNTKKLTLGTPLPQGPATKISNDTMIRAIEAKLKAMEQTPSDFSVCTRQESQSQSSDSTKTPSFSKSASTCQR